MPRDLGCTLPIVQYSLLSLMYANTHSPEYGGIFICPCESLWPPQQWVPRPYLYSPTVESPSGSWPQCSGATPSVQWCHTLTCCGPLVVLATVQWYHTLTCGGSWPQCSGATPLLVESPSDSWPQCSGATPLLMESPSDSWP